MNISNVTMLKYRKYYARFYLQNETAIFSAQTKEIILTEYGIYIISVGLRVSSNSISEDCFLIESIDKTNDLIAYNEVNYSLSTMNSTISSTRAYQKKIMNNYDKLIENFENSNMSTFIFDQLEIGFIIGFLKYSNYSINECILNCSNNGVCMLNDNTKKYSVCVI